MIGITVGFLQYDAYYYAYVYAYYHIIRPIIIHYNAKSHSTIIILILTSYDNHYNVIIVGIMCIIHMIGHTIIGIIGIMGLINACDYTKK